MHSSINFSAIVIACLIAVSVYGQSSNIEFTEYELDNGLKVLLHQDNTAPIVVVSVMYHVGSKNEAEGLTGFAHFFEHLMFEGSKHIDRGEYDQYVQNAGGLSNANTSQDRTYYFEIMPSNELELGLWLESERMLHAKVETKGIETQRQVVKEEYRERYLNAPYGSFLLKIVELAFSETPYEWAPIGSMDDINGAKESDYKRFYETYYVPNNAILSIAGNLDIEQTKAWVEQYFGGIPKGEEVKRPVVNDGLLAETVRDTVYDNIQLPGVFMGYRIPAQGTEDYYAVELLSKILSDGQSSRLYRSIVDEQQLAIQASNFPLALESAGLSIGIGIANAGVQAGDLAEAMIAIYESAGDELVSETEFQKVRNQVEADFINKNTSAAGIAENLATYEMFFGDANLINTELDRYLAVTRADIQRVAKKYFQESNRVLLIYLPKAQP